MEKRAKRKDPPERDTKRVKLSVGSKLKDAKSGTEMHEEVTLSDEGELNQGIKSPKKHVKKVIKTGNKGKDFITGDGKFHKDKILISAWNVNGLRAILKRKNLTDYIKENSPDILCIIETKLNDEQDALANTWIPSDYTYYFNCCEKTKGYSGIAVLTKVKPISVAFGIGKPKHDHEGRVITLEYENFYLVGAYVPNAGQRLERLEYKTKEWDTDFREYLNSLKQKKNVILCGDLNVAHQDIDIFEPKGHDRMAGFTKQERQDFTELLNSGWVDSFRALHPKEQKFSFWSARFNNKASNKGWRLDYFVVNKEAMKAVEDSKINCDISGSDHCPIELIFKPNFQKK